MNSYEVLQGSVSSMFYSGLQFLMKMELSLGLYFLLVTPVSSYLSPLLSLSQAEALLTSRFYLFLAQLYIFFGLCIHSGLFIPAKSHHLEPGMKVLALFLLLLDFFQVVFQCGLVFGGLVPQL